MHRAFVVWLTGHPWRAAVASAVCGALALHLSLPFLLLAVAIPVLVALRFGPRYALIMATVTAVTAALVVQPAVPAGPWLFIGLGLLFFSPALLGLLLAGSGSLNLCFQVAVLGMAAVLALLFMALPDPVGMWQGVLETVWASMATAGLRLEGEPEVIIAAWARTMWGALSAMLLAVIFGGLLLGRWWQSLLDAPGQFGGEYQALHLGRALGAAISVVFVAALMLDSALLACLVWLAVAALAFQGLAAAHRSRAVGRLERGWLVAIYVLLIVLPVTSIVVCMLAIWGFVDNWLRPRAQRG